MAEGEQESEKAAEPPQANAQTPSAFYRRSCVRESTKVGSEK